MIIDSKTVVSSFAGKNTSLALRAKSELLFASVNLKRSGRRLAL
jgi:hypothetical protein